MMRTKMRSPIKVRQISKAYWGVTDCSDVPKADIPKSLQMCDRPFWFWGGGQKNCILIRNNISDVVSKIWNYILTSPEDCYGDDDGEVDDNDCEDEDDTPPKLTAQAQRELSDGAYSPRGADTPTQDLISQIERHCDGYGEKNTDQDSFIQCCWHLSMINNNKQGCKRKDNLLNLIKLGFIFTRINVFM